MEQVKGVEPSSVAWEATVLPLNYTCADRFILIRLSQYILSQNFAKKKQIVKLFETFEKTDENPGGKFKIPGDCKRKTRKDKL